MRIALVSDTFTPQVNGVTTVLRRIVDVLAHERHTAAVVAPEYPDRSPVRADELRVPSVAFPPYPAIRLSLPAPRRIARFLDAFGPDLVHVATEGPLGWFGRRWALRNDVPLVTSAHTDFPRYCRYYGAPALEPVVWHWLVRFHAPAQLIHAPGAAIRDALRSRGLWQAVVWGNGVDTTGFHHARRDVALRSRLAIRDDQVVILHVGRLAAEKNVDVLVHAFALAREALGERARFVIAGEGPRSGLIAQRIPFATRLGFIAPADLAALYASADLCVLPSDTETCGLVALEAMASGLPVVAADAGGFRENIQHGRSGLLVAPRDARACAAAIVELAVDRERREAMSAAARLAAVGRDAGAENAELLDQYARVAGIVTEDAWRAA